jgi:hypothetical protein
MEDPEDTLTPKETILAIQAAIEQLDADDGDHAGQLLALISQYISSTCARPHKTR